MCLIKLLLITYFNIYPIAIKCNNFILDIKQNFWNMSLDKYDLESNTKKNRLQIYSRQNNI